MEFIAAYVLPPILLGFLVALVIVGVRNLTQRMRVRKSIESAPSRPAGPKAPEAARENQRVCVNGHPKAGKQKVCDECGQQ